MTKSSPRTEIPDAEDQPQHPAISKISSSAPHGVDFARIGAGSQQGRADGQAAIYPGPRLHFLHLLSRVRYEDWEIEYWDVNQFAFLENGDDLREFDWGGMLRIIWVVWMKEGGMISRTMIKS
ncbi:hypothetical protein KC352_g4773 [Hortaea werneckii]|nr:hypothetical protein KC358_g11471 [Hortaea werneckii]KAI7026387.1 hypothetical protein KC362_g11693 [Hortaea werneckii]KAI7286808.1 hypothetical protein KC352_g4773 [Hortaea werneckii]